MKMPTLTASTTRLPHIAPSHPVNATDVNGKSQRERPASS